MDEIVLFVLINRTNYINHGIFMVFFELRYFLLAPNVTAWLFKRVV